MPVAEKHGGAKGDERAKPNVGVRHPTLSVIARAGPHALPKAEYVEDERRVHVNLLLAV